LEKVRRTKEGKKNREISVVQEKISTESTKMVGASSLQPRLLSSFVGDRLLLSKQPVSRLFLYKPGPFSLSSVYPAIQLL
jgi:hypothetical protein